MSYGLLVQGNDTGGDFIVSDTQQSMVNQRVVESGTATHSITLDSALNPSDMVFVRNPVSPTGSYTPYTKYYNHPTNGTSSVTLSFPTFIYIVISSDSKTLEFKGGALGQFDAGYMTGPVDFVYRGWDVAVDYFIVRDVQTTATDGNNTNDAYGLQILNANGDVSFDSRSVTTNETFAVNAVAQMQGTGNPANNVQAFMFGSIDSYVNIEWTAFTNSFHVDGYGGEQLTDIRIRGLGIYSDRAYVYDGWLDSEPGVGFFWYPVLTALFAAKVYTGAPPAGGVGSTGTGAGGSISVSNSGVVTEGQSTITVSASATVSDIYHINVTRETGDGTDDFLNPYKQFTGTSTTLVLSPSNDGVSELGWQGESFTAELRTGSSQGGGVVIDSVDFTLYDNDGGTTLVGTSSGSTYNIYSGDSAADLEFSFSTSGPTATETLNARIVPYGTSTVIKTFTMTSGSNSQVQLTTNLPTAGNTTTYSLQIYNGNDWIDARTFSVFRSTDSGPLQGTTPTSAPVPTGGNPVQVLALQSTFSQNFSGCTTGELIRVLRLGSQVGGQSTVTNGNGTVTVSGIPSPPQGSTYSYTVEVQRNGGSWVAKSSGNFSAYRETESQGPLE